MSNDCPFDRGIMNVWIPDCDGDDVHTPPDHGPPTPSCIPIFITSSLPESVEIAEGDDYIFNISVNEDATTPITVQWYKNGAAIPGETGESYTLTGTRYDTGAEISYIVTNECAGESTSATLIVITDIVPPECLPYYCESLGELLRTFENTWHWTFLHGGPAPSLGVNDIIPAEQGPDLYYARDGIINSGSIEYDKIDPEKPLSGDLPAFCDGYALHQDQGTTEFYTGILPSEDRIAIQDQTFVMGGYFINPGNSAGQVFVLDMGFSYLGTYPANYEEQYLSKGIGPRMSINTFWGDTRIGPVLDTSKPGWYVIVEITNSIEDPGVGFLRSVGRYTVWVDGVQYETNELIKDHVNYNLITNVRYANIDQSGVSSGYYFHYFMGGKGGLLDSDELAAAFNRNFSDYEPPEYCEIFNS